MRYLFGLLCVCALCLVPVVGCFEIEPFTTACTGVDCDDGNECTRDYCIQVYPAGTCGHELVANGTPCGGGNVCVNGACVEFDGTWPCTEQGIRDAIAVGGGPHTFDCSSRTPVVTLAEIEIDNDVTLDGEGNLIVDASGGHIVFSVATRITAELVGVTVTGGTGHAGGIYNEGALSLINSTVSRNAGYEGGGIYGSGGSLTLINSTVSGNNADGLGGGIAGGFDHLTLINSAVSGNMANNGGGIGGWGNVMTLTNSTVSGNTANGGGGIRSGFQHLTLTNSTVSGNTAGFAGGIGSEGAMTLTNSTVSGNSGGGIFSERSGTLTLTNSLVDGECFTDEDATTTSKGHNIESPGDTCGFNQPTDQVDITAEQLNLGPLEDNGGPTMTHSLGEGSVAIDVIPAGECVDVDGAPLRTDQRSFSRDSRCDVGAYEFGAQEAQPSGGGGGCSLVHREDAPGIWLLAVLALLGIRLASRRKAKRV